LRVPAHAEGDTVALIVVHLRWDDVDTGQHDELCRLLPDGAGRSPDCLSRQRRRQGRAVLGTEVWADELSADLFLAGLADLLAPVGLGPPQVVAFAVPDCFAVGYGVPLSRMAPATGPAPVIPRPRPPADSQVGPDPG
jgi:hypothetical protein